MSCRSSRPASTSRALSRAPSSEQDLEADASVWEEEQVARMLELGEEDEDSDDAPNQAAGAAAACVDGARRPPEQPGQPQAGPEAGHHDSPQQLDSGSEQWSEITDPFEEFHVQGALKV